MPHTPESSTTNTATESSTPNLAQIQAEVKKAVRTIPDYPKPGILFYDITTILDNASCLKSMVDFWKARYEKENITHIVGIESRGFTFGTALAYALGVSFVPVRKKGKLPYKTYSKEYEFEYRSDVVEIHIDAFDSVKKSGKKARVVLVDDLLATGGTAAASLELVEKAGGECVEACFLIRLVELGGAEKLNVKYMSILDV
ncbi:MULTISPECIES: adenine phosphoribosyltransferase [unclassified Helicobacter]|uniref:adenine phosphoribosyltransferase n=1 Tax=unclassified Helicobacter TaxID=2593540 RepID=UPI0009ECD049|nr:MULTISPECIES: adenine phosphoribosyltransferase [unclassified Helicobacter]